MSQFSNRQIIVLEIVYKIVQILSYIYRDILKVDRNESRQIMLILSFFGYRDGYTGFSRLMWLLGFWVVV